MQFPGVGCVEYRTGMRLVLLGLRAFFRIEGDPITSDGGGWRVRFTRDVHSWREAGVQWSERRSILRRWQVGRIWVHR